MGQKLFNTAVYANKALPVAADLLPLGDSAAQTGGVNNNKTCTVSSIYQAVGAVNSTSVCLGLTAGANIAAGGTNNVAIGVGAANALSTGDDVTAVGFNAALLATVTCTAIGSQALAALTSGTLNTAVGFKAGNANQTGTDNVYLGHNAGVLHTGSTSTILGRQAINVANSGNNIVAIGYNAGQNCTTGNVVIIGGGAGSAGAIGDGTVLIGTNAGTDGNLTAACTGIGHEVFAVLTSSARCTALGHQAGKAIVDSGADCTLVGYQAGVLITGANNTALGSGALDSCTEGTDNTAVGKGAITATLTTGDHNTAIGANTVVSAADAQYQTLVGDGATGTANNQVTLGRVATDTVNCGKTGRYFAIATAGWGVPAIYGQGRVDGTIDARAAAAATYTVGAADASFEVSGNVLVTASVTHSFSLDVSYTDEGNTARTLILPMALITGSYISGGLITNVTGAGPYHGAVLQIRCKASTTITIRVSNGTFTSVTYNSEGTIKQVA